MNKKTLSKLRELNNDQLADILIVMLINGDEGVEVSFINRSCVSKDFSLMYSPTGESPRMVNFSVSHENLEVLTKDAPQYTNKVSFIKRIREVTNLALLESKLLSEQVFNF